MEKEDKQKSFSVEKLRNSIHIFFKLTPKKIINILVIEILLIFIHYFLKSAYNIQESLLIFIALILIPLFLILSLSHTFIAILIKKGFIRKIEKKVKYPKFILLFLTFILAYFIFAGRSSPSFEQSILDLGYLGTFIAGVLSAYGFTAAPSVSIFLILAKTQNILIGGIIGGLGALLADLLIFKFIRFSFENEIIELEHEKLVMKFEKQIPTRIKHYLLPVIAGFIIASPLPDEVGVSLMAVLKNIKSKTFILISFILHTIATILIMYAGTFLS